MAEAIPASPAPPPAAPQLQDILAAIDKFESDLGFTAPELTGMRIEQLRSRVRAIFEPDEDDFDDEDGDDA